MKLLHTFSAINMIVGTLITMSSSSWIVAWLGMELNILGFLPLLNSNNPLSKEACMKYFIIQSIASSIFIFASSISILIPSYPLSTQILLLALATKLALAPFHFWLPSVSDCSEWKAVFLLLSWQKIAPMILVIQISPKSITIFIIMSSIIGSIMIFNQTSMKKIMAYSSISHMSWMMLASMMNKFLLLTYFILYIMILSPILLALSFFNINTITHMNYLNKNIKFFLWLSILSMAGFPPLLGFFQKIMVISYSSINNKLIITTIILLIFSIIALFSYTRTMFSSISHNSNSPFFSSPLTSWITMFSMTFIMLLTPTTLLFLIPT